MKPTNVLAATSSSAMRIVLMFYRPFQINFLIRFMHESSLLLFSHKEEPYVKRITCVSPQTHLRLKSRFLPCPKEWIRVKISVKDFGKTFGYVNFSVVKKEFFSEKAREQIEEAIRGALGNEVFFVGSLDGD